MNRLSIAIPAYKSAERLGRCLKSIENIDSKWLSDAVVVDDSGDGQVVENLKDKYPAVHWIRNNENLGFAIAANRAVNACTSEWVLLLNDDSELTNDPRNDLKQFLANDTLFAVSLQSTNEFGEVREGAKRIVWRFGIAKVLHNIEDQLLLVDGVSDTSYAVGGHAVFRKPVFCDLEGFDNVYHPFYWEDVDLSQRALALGWKIQYASNIRILHRADGAIKSTQAVNLIRSATWKNRFLFSYRHSKGVHRVLFPLGVLWHKVHALVTGDSAKLQAISEFKNQSSSR